MSKENPKPAAWITWEIQTRNRSMAENLEIPLYELISNKGRILRYLSLGIKTLSIMRRYKIIFVQNPSIVLSFIASIIKFFSKKQLIVDAHNSGVFPLEGRNRFLNAITRFICRTADSVIVTNNSLAKQVSSWGGNPIVLPDPLPNFNDTLTSKEYNERFIFFICTWASDEPYQEVIQAAKLIPEDVKIFITGNYNKVKKQLPDLPENVKLLGFIDEAQYLFFLSKASASMDLTTRDNCLVCGAYESASLQTPCIISDTNINREVFNQGFVYTQNNKSSIASAILLALAEKNILSNQIAAFKEEHIGKTETIIKEIKKEYLM